MAKDYVTELETRKQVYEEPVKRVDQLNLVMDASMDKIGGYARESADALEKENAGQEYGWREY